VAWQVRQIIDWKVFSQGNQRESQSKVVSFQSFLWNKHVDKHGIQVGKLHTPKAISEEPIVDLYNRNKNVQVAFRSKNNI
jgi:hypothetical protein